MEKITPLERELLRSVSELLNGTEKEIAALKLSLKAYDANAAQSIIQRLSGVEKAQETLTTRLASIEKTLENWQEVTIKNTKNLTQQMENYATQAKRLETLLTTLLES